jgi:hypothetical protein
MCIRSILQEVLGLHGPEQRNRGQSREDPSHLGNAVSKDHETASTTHWKVSNIESVHLTIHQQVPSFLQNIKEGLKWSDECEEAFSQLKKYLASSPLLSRTVQREVLYVYLAVSPTAISATLIREEEGVQKPVYFVSKALHEAEERYLQIEKLAFALVIASRKLRPYFQAHTI